MLNRETREKTRELFMHLRCVLSLTEELISAGLSENTRPAAPLTRTEPSSSKPPTSQLDQKLFLTVKDICEATGLGRSTIFKSISEGRLRKVKYGNKTLVHVEDFRTWVKGWKVS